MAKEITKNDVAVGVGGLLVFTAIQMGAGYLISYCVNKALVKILFGKGYRARETAL